MARSFTSSVAHQTTACPGGKLGEAGVFLLFLALFAIAFLV